MYIFRFLNKLHDLFCAELVFQPLFPAELTDPADISLGCLVRHRLMHVETVRRYSFIQII